MTVIEELPLLGRSDQMPGERPGAKAPFTIELTELRNRALDDAPSHPTFSTSRQ